MGLLLRLRASLPLASAVALVVLGLLAFRSILDRDARVRQRMVDELEERLAEAVQEFEDRVLREVDGMLADASAPVDELDALDRQWRRTRPWFDGLYVWHVQRGAAGDVLAFDHPRVPTVDPPSDLSCAVDARAQAQTSEALPGLLLRACLGESRLAQAYATMEAAQLLREAGQPHAALDALDALDLDDAAPLRAYPRVPVARRVARRLLRATLLDEVGDTLSARRLREATVIEIADLPAPELEATLFLVPGLVERMAGDPGASRLRKLAARAEQRLAAWRELGRNATRTGGGPASEAARFTFDQYSDAPYLLYLRRSDAGGVALQLRQEVLLASFLSGSGFLQEVVITDLSGRPVAGRVDQARSDVVVPFAASLTHLRASITAPSLAARAGSSVVDDALPLAVTVALCIVLGFAGLWAQRQANQRSQQLLHRQAEFTARVTHELKTPLAGIRVMAEGLGTGSYKDTRQRTQMADRILQEVDRLTGRINEVLNAAKSRELPEPEPVDLEEVLLDLIDTWGPRYEQDGVDLQADLAPTATVLGDPVALRDALACLLDNALKYRREDVESRVWLDVRQTARTIEIEVRDNGLGVPAAQRAAIFERYVRVEGDHRGRAGGHGLGLAQVHDIVTAHGGTVSCEEGVDGGARFVVRLRATDEAPTLEDL